MLLENWIAQTFKWSLIFKKRFVFLWLVSFFSLLHSLSLSFEDPCSPFFSITQTSTEGPEKRDHCRIPFQSWTNIHHWHIHSSVQGHWKSSLSSFPSLQGAMLKRANPWCEEIGEFSARPMVPGIELKLSIFRWLSIGAPGTRRQRVLCACFVYLKFYLQCFNLIFLWQKLYHTKNMPGG